MKKLMVMAAVVCAAVAAQAETSYFASVLVHKYDKDPQTSNENATWYSVYLLSQADAQEAMGTEDNVTYETYATWLGKNFEVNKQKTIDNAQGTSYDSCTVNQYVFVNYDFKASSLSGALGVAFFENDDGDLAYSVLGNQEGIIDFNFDSEYYDFSGWIAVPEPTSGLLMLLGMAGLALKRKNRK